MRRCGMTAVIASVALACLLSIVLAPSGYAAVPLLIDYQGRLTDASGTPVSATKSMTFSIYSAASGGTPLWTETQTDVVVTGGIFGTTLGKVTPLDPLVVTGTLYLGVAVSPDGEMTPRQKISSTAFSLRAGVSDGVAPGAVTASMLGESCAEGQVLKRLGGAWACAADNTAGYMLGSGLVLSGSILSLDNVFTDARYWRTGGNTGTTPGAHYVGTTDNVALEFKVYGQRALRIEPNATSPNVIGGNSANSVSAGVYGATIGGGGESGIPNRVRGAYGTVAGGVRNSADNVSATVGGGSNNIATGNGATVGGGAQNTASNYYAMVGGGQLNIAGNYHSTVGGGFNDNASGMAATVGGGESNTAGGGFSTVGGGAVNTAGGTYATVPGGSQNLAGGDYSFAAGRRARATHAGSFVWGDATNADVPSPGDNTFTVRAAGGTTVYSDIALTNGVKLLPGKNYWSSVGGGGGGFSIADNGSITFSPTQTFPTTIYSAGNGLALSGNTLSVDTGYTDNLYLKLGGNPGTAGGAKVLGSTDNVAVEVIAYGTRALRIEPNPFSPNMIGGHGANSVAAGIYGATIGGGGNGTFPNRVSGHNATVGGGRYNTASSNFATVGGGNVNTASGNTATVGGGFNDNAAGNYATVPGGYYNLAAGDYSFAAGRQANANHAGAFVWGDNTAADVTSSAANQFVARASGGVTFYSSSDLTKGSRLNPNSGSWESFGAAPDNYTSWRLGGNTGTTPGTHYIGTSDNVALEFKVYGARALRVEPHAISPNVIGGYSGNSVAAGVYGATIGGGGEGGTPNRVMGNYGTVGGGDRNTATGNGATVGGGGSNTTSGQYATAGGGNWNIASGISATVGGGTQNTASGDVAVVGGGQYNTASGLTSTVGGGQQNTASNSYATVGGGGYNTASNFTSTVGGGTQNTSSGVYSTVGGGYQNVASADNAVVSGGGQNLAGGVFSTVGGGYQDNATGYAATVGGGYRNTAGGWYATVGGGYNSTASDFYTTIGGGYANHADNTYATVGGGRNNASDGIYSTIGGGYFNYAKSQEAVVAGGYGNTAGNTGATVGGGYSNSASGQYATVAGGRNNTAAGQNSTIGGGWLNQTVLDNAVVCGGTENKAEGPYTTVAGGTKNWAYNSGAFVGGGYGNVAYGPASFVAGGSVNRADGYFSAIVGGAGNRANGQASFVAGGSDNRADGQNAAIPGGVFNQANGWNSFAAGRYAGAIHDSSFVWGDGSAATASWGINQFIARASGGFALISGGAGDPGVGLAAGAGAWGSLSDRNMKENFVPASGVEVLEKVAALSIATWNLKTQDPSIRHIGPVAQDFRAAFGLGEDEKRISTVDADGVALAAIQGLYKLVREQAERIRELETERARDASRFRELEARLSAIETGGNRLARKEAE